MLRRLIAPSLILLTVTLAAWYTVDSLRPEAAPDIAGLAAEATPTSPLTSTPTSTPTGITEPVIAKGPDHEPNARPSEWFWQQRAYPHGDIKQSSYALMLEQAAAKEREAQLARTGGDKSLILSAQWEQRGPSNIGARVTDLAIHPGDPNIVYAAMASGGIFKTVDGGSNWTPIFDDQPVLTIGAVTLDPQNPETIYVGTGEANAISYSFFGLGVFKSSDGGVSWQHLGLEATRYIARIVVDPTDSDRIYLAATGKLFGTGPNRGIYRSLDGGLSWEQSLALTDSTAATDLVINPENPQILYAAMWERVRGRTYRRSGGPSSSIWRSIDGGDSWQQLGNGLPTGENVGRMGITLCASQPNRLYVIHADASAGFEGVYRSDDGGDTWSGTNDGNMGSIFSSFGWYFGNVRVDPSNPDNVFALGVPFYRTTNGGSSWNEVGSNMHVDHHALAFAPSQPARVYNGNDGGLYRSNNSGASWNKLFDQPTNQFYAIEIDYQQPERLYGGTQDNGTNRTLTGSVDDWERIFGGDGFYTIIDPTDNDIIFVEYQWGNLFKSTNGGDWFDWSMSGIDESDRSNWMTPYVMDPSNPQKMFFGTYRLYASTDQGDSWSTASDDLTGGNQGANFGTITTIAVAPSNPATVFVGTDDGRVWVSSLFGGGWNLVNSGLPDRWVTRVEVDPVDATVAYVTFSGLRWDEPISHVYRTANRGASWQDISSDLPEAPVNVIRVDPDHSEILYVGCDVGVYVSTNTGASWQVMGEGLPRAPVLDLKFHQPTRTLVAGTHGRSMFAVEAPEPTAVGEDLPAVAATLRLSNHPNPFNPATTIAFSLPSAGRVELAIYNLRGERVARLLDEERAAGEHSLRWNGHDELGHKVPSGVYFARLQAGEMQASHKLTLAQ